ncbi:MAG: GPW/gp25 family protein [Reichenbachiella sp.]|uniref:GPW/gp25 family protein n=1 Tax=Reichenbachiella sp. TaxID=2184521 RepID=UPI0029663103|nr:GPW/gp25 family protein [Reichenbachiella sp.]MDW3211147.1 GPW/gp25 family protein [Reichenbachiella sp.]
MIIQENEFIGIGWGSPPVFVKGSNEVLMTKNVQNINENLKLLFSTRQGERALNHAYGTELNKLVFCSQNSLLESEIKESLKRNVRLYEPRITVDDISIDTRDQVDGFIAVKLTYTIRKVNSRHNFVFPFYINEGTNLEP